MPAPAELSPSIKLALALAAPHVTSARAPGTLCSSIRPRRFQAVPPSLLFAASLLGWLLIDGFAAADSPIRRRYLPGDDADACSRGTRRGREGRAALAMGAIASSVG